jgi:biopolymer transport protein ExbB
MDETLDPAGADADAAAGVEAAAPVADPAAPAAAAPEAAPPERAIPDAAIPDGPAPEGLAATLDMVLAGGPVVLILAAMSVAATAIVLLKLWQFARAGLGRRRAVGRALALAEAGDMSGAHQAAQRAGGPAAAVLALAAAGRLDGWDEPRLREAAWARGVALVEGLRAWSRPLETIATLAPLLGLFGTVLGMIAAFAQMEAAGARVDPSVLSGGIWEALLTTAAGLAVAIPAAAAAAWFDRRVEREEHLIEATMAAFFTGAAAAPRAEPAPQRREERLHAAAGLRSL